MAKNDDLFTTLRQRGLRKSVAKAIADAEGAGKKGTGKAEAVARDALKDLAEAGDAIRARVLDGGKRSQAGKKAAATRTQASKTAAATRSQAGKKAAATRKREATKRSEAAKRGAATRKARAKSR
jgi:hypothetical protein